MTSQAGGFYIAEIKALASQFSAEEIDECMALTLERQGNPCVAHPEAEKAMDALAKAQFVKARMEQGMTQQEAIRELGRRIRAVQGASR